MTKVMMVLALVIIVGCHKATAPVVNQETCNPCPADKKDCTKTDSCCQTSVEKAESRVVLGTIVEVSMTSSGNLLVRFDDRTSFVVNRDSDFLVNGTQVVPQDVVLWFKQLKQPAKAKLLVSRMVVLRAEFWVDKMD